MIVNKSKGFNKVFILIVSLIFLFNCEAEKKSCQNILECLDGTVWVPKGRESYWRIFNDPTGVYMDVHLINNGCLVYDTPQTVGASLVSLNKNSFVESYDDREWMYSIVNDTVIEKVRLTGGNTNYFFKRDNSEFEKLISEYDYCN